MKKIYFLLLALFSLSTASSALTLINETDYNLDAYLFEPDTAYAFMPQLGISSQDNQEKAKDYYNDYAGGCNMADFYRGYYQYNILYSRKSIDTGVKYKIEEIKEIDSPLCVQFINADRGPDNPTEASVAGFVKPIHLTEECTITVTQPSEDKYELKVENCVYHVEP